MRVTRASAAMACTNLDANLSPRKPSFPRKRESRRLQPNSPSEIKRKYQPADPFSLYGLTRVGCEIRLSPPSFPRKRESTANNVILAKAGTSSPSEIKYKYQPADPFSLRGLTGVGFEIRLSPPSFPRKRESRWSQPRPLYEIKYELKPADPFSLHGRRLG